MIRNYPNPYGSPHPSPPVQGGWAGRQMPAPQAGGNRQGLPPIQPGQYNGQMPAQFQQPPFYRGNPNPPPQGYAPPFTGHPMEQPQQPRKKGLFRSNSKKNDRQGPQAPPDAEQPQKKGMAKLFNKKNSGNAVQPSLFSLPSGSVRESREAASRAASAGGGGFLQNLAKPGTINSMLDNTQKFLQAAEAFGPVVQQYGPYLKKLPSLLNIGKGDEAAEEGTTNNGNRADTVPTTVPAQEPVSVTANRANPSPKKIQPISTGGTAVNKAASQRYMAGESLPKLFI